MNHICVLFQNVLELLKGLNSCEVSKLRNIRIMGHEIQEKLF